ncbi:MAG: tetratricopeptide repeat protein [Acidobacteriota bacterium]|nr:tetratricopeptide repeat protein [Acidobacteriota bacterium]
MTTESGHPGSGAFHRLVHGLAPPEETREIVRHLLSGCAVCGKLADAARTSPQPAEGWSYDAVFERLEERLAEGVQTLQGERATARELYSELLGHEAVEGLVQVQSTRRYASLALCELLLEKSQELAAVDPEQAHKAAQFAVAVTEQLDLDLYGAPVVQDLRALAWAYFANVRRVQADLRAALGCLALAERLLAQGTGDPLARAELLTLEASLLSHTGRFAEAHSLCNQAASIYRRVGDHHLLGRTLIKKGTILGNSGQSDAAIRLIRRGIDLIDPPREPRLMVAATHNLIWFLNETGRTGQAASCLDSARRLYTGVGDRRHLSRLRWLEGKVAPDSGTAERALLEASESLAREGLSYEAALAAMDLAVLYAGERRDADMRRQAQQMLPLFRSGDMYRETVVALQSFQRRDSSGHPTGLLHELGSYIRRAREEKNPPALAAGRANPAPLSPL